ncbi:choice-of-anchor Q domain-containing protein [Reticulibacter mediterranei]|nr:choice-of-anchor Q domain-containing protein [Reticulibacter mediterranei]
MSIGTEIDNTDGGLGDNFIVANNISINNALLGIREREGVGPNNQFVNNIVYGNGKAVFGEEDYEWPSAAESTDQGIIMQNVQFVQFQADGSGNYRLQSNSPAIDAGIAISILSTDFDGRPRPQGKGIDIGPFES